jgi:hypothetical protein
MSFPRKRESSRGAVLSGVHRTGGVGFRIETIAYQGFAHAFSPKPAVQLLRSRRRNVSFAEAIRKPRFHGAFFMPAVIPAFYVIPAQAAVRRIGI